MPRQDSHASLASGEAVGDRHLDGMWEVELAEAHKRGRMADVDTDHRIDRYVEALRRHYRQRTPRDLSQRHLRAHAQYLAHRHKRLVEALNNLISPRSENHRLAAACAQQEAEWRIAFHVVCEARATIIKEMRQNAHYWKWVRQHRRLPSWRQVCLWRLNHRPIAHPWRHLAPEMLETMGNIQKAIAEHLADTRSYSKRWRIDA